MPTRVRNRYVPDREGVVGILTSPPMQAALSRVGQNGKKIAESLAPVETGKYKASFEVRLSTRGRGKRKRAMVTLKNTDPKAAALEFGNKRSRGRRVLGRTQSAMRVAGYVS